VEVADNHASDSLALVPGHIYGMGVMRPSALELVPRVWRHRAGNRQTNDQQGISVLRGDVKVDSAFYARTGAESREEISAAPMLQARYSPRFLPC